MDGSFCKHGERGMGKVHTDLVRKINFCRKECEVVQNNLKEMSGNPDIIIVKLG
jgi:hypothetical protein